MTTIAYRDGVIAADTGCGYGASTHAFAVKIAAGHDGSLHGVCGKYAEAFEYLKWVKDGMNGDAPKTRITDNEDYAFEVLMVDAEGNIHDIEGRGTVSIGQAPYYAVGAGAAAALAAMFCGASAELAVYAAIEHGDHTFGKVITMSSARIKAILHK